MDCHEIEDLLPRYAAGELGETDSIEVDSHTRDCPQCKRALDGYIHLENTLAALGDDLPTAIDVASSAMKRLGFAEKRSGLRWLVGLPSLSAIGAFIILFTLIIHYKAVSDLSISIINAVWRIVTAGYGLFEDLVSILPHSGFWLQISVYSIISLSVIAFGGNHVLKHLRE